MISISLYAFLAQNVLERFFFYQMRLDLPCLGVFFLSVIPVNASIRERFSYQGLFECVHNGLLDHTGCHHFLRTDSDMEKTKSLIARIQLGKFFAILQSYASKDHFNYVKFSNQAVKMNQDFLEIKRLVESIPMHDDLASELEFPTHMFQVMAHSATFLKDISNDKSRDHLSVYHLTDLSVRILALHNVRGMLDTTNSKSEEKIISLHRELRELVSTFVHEGDSESIMNWMFKDLAIQAEQDLQKLWQQVSVHGIACLSKTDQQKCIQLP